MSWLYILWLLWISGFAYLTSSALEFGVKAIYGLDAYEPYFPLIWLRSKEPKYNDSSFIKRVISLFKALTFYAICMVAGSLLFIPYIMALLASLILWFLFGVNKKDKN